MFSEGTQDDGEGDADAEIGEVSREGVFSDSLSARFEFLRGGGVCKMLDLVTTLTSGLDDGCRSSNWLSGRFGDGEDETLGETSKLLSDIC